MRIVSLAPTQTEIIAALNGEACLMGISENCDYPEQIRGLPTYGSWWSPDLLKVLKDEPDLVCTFGKHQEEVAATLRETGLRVVHSDPETVEESLETFRELALILEREETAEQLLRPLKKRLEKVERSIGSLTPSDYPRVLRIMNWNPLISVGPGSFQHDVIRLAGGRNIMEDALQPYMVCAPELAVERNPQAIFFCETHLLETLHNEPAWRKVDAVRKGNVFVFECGLTCRSGPRIVDMVEGLASALHPDVFRSARQGG